MDIIQLVTGVLIAGESLALYVIMRLRDSPWINPINTAYVAIDILVGLILLASGYDLIPVKDIILIIATLLHIYRDYAVYKILDNPFAFNLPLLVVLNIRLIALSYIILKK
jgi:hypothetical protein